MIRTRVLGMLCLAVVLLAAGALVRLVTGASSDRRPAALGALAAGVAPSQATAPRASSSRRERAPLAEGAPAPVPVARPSDDSPRARRTPVLRPPGSVVVSFEMDPRVTKSLHMGTRWVSPPTYVGTHQGALFTVRARAHGPEAGRVFGEATWLASEPDMVAVTPDRGSEVEIAILREGLSTLTISQGRALKTLSVKAVQHDGVWRVDIAQ